ncbi:hypothetical protein [Polyangium jinanense]|uniref:Uncharacterized protein n=1 Tax=Polyangium jinanense TaxID=2829994 RepID=A0A9X4AUE0_9BACT|nr:hypothetical protein [Polyangium jinanense]MDC3955806.1 hypothetical protein [Polyangium jinanense]MDC3983165.1 hypothetical protein [Polyangium jinanense]
MPGLLFVEVDAYSDPPWQGPLRLDPRAGPVVEDVEMTFVALPKLSVPLLDFHLGGGRLISLVKVNDMGFAYSAPKLANLCLSECFDAPENRLGGAVSFPKDFSPANQAGIMSHPFRLLNCVAVEAGDDLTPISPVELQGLTRVCVERKLKTKKGRPVDPRDLDATPGVFMIDSSSPTIHSAAEVHAEGMMRIGLVRFSGTYRQGSEGLDDAVLIGRVLNMFCAMIDPDGMIVDMSDLDYRYGNDLHVATYKFHGARSPIVVVVKPHQLDAYRDAGINCIGSDGSAAMGLAVERATEWARGRVAP